MANKKKSPQKATVRRAAPALPFEILLKIFRMTKRRHIYDLAANRTLPKLARVNKAWLETARELLYTSVYLGNSEYLARSVKHLLRTLKASPGLAARVRGIYFGSFDMVRTETINLARIIDICGPLNLQNLQINGYNGFELKELRAAMTTAVHLQSLQITRYSMRDQECDPFCGIARFFVMMQCWPDLRSIMLYQDVLSVFWEDDDGDGESTDEEDIEKMIEEAKKERDEREARGWDVDEEEEGEEGEEEDEEDDSEEALEKKQMKVSFPVKPGALPKFERFEDRDNFRGRHVLALSKLAPNLRTLILSAKPLFSPSGLAALQTWSHSLSRLTINTEPSSEQAGKFTGQLTDVLSAMTSLSELEIGRKCIPSSAFAQPDAFPALEKLEFRIEAKSDDIHVLTKVFKAQPVCLPSLREFVPTTSFRAFSGGYAAPNEFGNGVYQALKDACDKRGVKLKNEFASELERMATEHEVTDQAKLKDYFEFADDEAYSDEEDDWEEDDDEDEETGDDEDSEEYDSEDEEHEDDEDSDS